MAQRRFSITLLLCVLLIAAGVAACGSKNDGARPSTSPVDPTNDFVPPPDPEQPGVATGTVDAGSSDASDNAYLSDKKAHCIEISDSERLPQRNAPGTSASTFSEVRLQLLSACSNCHLFPAASGGFAFQDQRLGSDLLVDGKPQRIPGFIDIAEKAAKAVVSGAMPPLPRNKADRGAYDALGRLLNDWILAGKPAGSFAHEQGRERGPLQPRDDVRDNMTTLGDCIPDALGSDAAMDQYFGALQQLPERLSQTDFFSLDSYALAKRGTVAYAPAYPLWSDGAKKIRHVHLPVDASGARQSMQWDEQTHEFKLPENTRIYKTFLKPVRTTSGETRYRKAETRLIVVRAGDGATLFASYRWNEAEDEATLVTAPYRSGAAFKDTVFTLLSDERTQTTRTYAIPAKHRCLECHEGASGKQFALGLTPLQLNRRPEKQGGVLGSVGASELSQMERFRSYGAITGVPLDAPTLERAGKVAPKSERELSAQGYLLGNCTHCHNPNGFAVRQDRKLLPFDLSAGKLAEFNTSARGASSGGLLVVPGDAEKSEVYTRVANETSLAGAVAIEHMPLHTLGIDCQAATVVGRWIAGLPVYPSANPSAEDRAKADAEAEQRAAAFEQKCGTNEPSWLEEDFTESDPYRPRRADWNQPGSGIPQALRESGLTGSLAALSKTPIAVGYWNKKPACSFPDAALPKEAIRPWMNNTNGTPKRPYGEVFSQTAGAFYFATVCQKCHGARADGETGIAKMISQQTGGNVRVANLRDGLFGKLGANLALFDTTNAGGVKTNLAGNYLIWMASGGTNVTFPPAFSELVGPYGPNMLNRVRTQFARLLPGAADSYPTYYQTYEVFARVATQDNPVTDEAGFNPDGSAVNVAAQKTWLDRAQANAGWMLYTFFRDEAMKERWPKTPNDCESVFAKP
jgi:hypothetical protein